MADRITILGAGLVGSLIARRLAQEGYRVTVLEKRPDPRTSVTTAGRSINLALAERGREALRLAGLLERVEPLLVTMRGRMLHPLPETTGESPPPPHFQAYGQRSHEVIYSVSRSELNGLLMTAAEEVGVGFEFQQDIARIDLDTKELHRGQGGGSETLPRSYEMLLGVDGAGSLVRDAIAAHSGTYPERERFEHGYKELTIAATSNGQHVMEREALHIWPRGGFMLIALPNRDGTFTATLFAPWNVLKDMDDSAFGSGSHPIVEFFHTHFPDAISLIPELVEQFQIHPTGSLSTVRCWPWHFRGSALILGDAAHAIVPFHGQGMNCGFEDCQALIDALREAKGNWAAACSRFAEVRKPNADAIAAMAIENYVVMRDQVRDPRFAFKRELELALERRCPDRFIPRYAQVMFHHIPYAEALRRGAWQDRFMAELIQDKSGLAEIDLDSAVARLEREYPR